MGVPDALKCIAAEKYNTNAEHGTLEIIRRLLHWLLPE
jgi:hypothetical protein